MMLFRDKLIIFFSIVFCLGFLAAAGMQMDYINNKRVEMELVSNEPLKNAPPALAFSTVALGAFRGLVVDVLWMRADRLKSEGQFYDAKQLAEWITTLQPRFADVWEFQAWNMAYNISVSFPADEPEERWRWVRNGIELLRDEGIQINPNAIQLYRELARIFQHKIGGFTDDVHKYYKIKLAEAMEPLLGSGDNEYFEKLISAPKELDDLKAEPETAKIITALKKSDESFEDESKFAQTFLSLKETPQRFNDDSRLVLDTYKDTQGFENIQLYSAAYQLRNKWKMEPELMHKVNQTYGPTPWDDPDSRVPLDWRLPDAHAIYWAVKGFETAGRGDSSMAEVNTDRIIGHSIQSIFRNGKIFMYESPILNDQGQQIGTRKDIFLRPDLRMFNTYNQVMLDTMKMYEESPLWGTGESFRTGYRNMLTNALYSFYQSGHIKKAEKIYAMLREKFPERDFDKPLAVFVHERLREELSSLSYSDVRETIVMLLRESYFRFALDDTKQAYAKEKMAKQIYDHFYSTSTDQDRIDLPDFKFIRFAALLDFFNDQQYPPDLRMKLVQKIEKERPELAEEFEEQQRKLQLQIEQRQKNSEQ